MGDFAQWSNVNKFFQRGGCFVCVTGMQVLVKKRSNLLELVLTFIWLKGKGEAA